MLQWQLVRHAACAAAVVWCCAAPAQAAGGDAPHTVQAQGELQVLVEDRPRGSVVHHILKTAQGPLELRFKNRPPRLRSGDTLQVSGVQNGNILAVGSSSTTSSNAVAASAAAPLANTSGAQKLLVLLVNFTDDASQPWTAADARSLVFGSTSSFYLENSYGQTSLAGDVYGWYSLPIASTCNVYDISSAARQAASNAGVNLSAYSRTLYVFPPNNTCGWSGQGQVGGLPSEAWINGDFQLKIVGHELGHNLGLDHSHEWTCDTTPISANCQVNEYGDAFDTMADTTSGHFNAFQKERLGWLNSGAMPPITTVQANGTYSIDPYETADGKVKALKILKSTDPTTGAHTWYYVEYRQPTGFDSSLSALSGTNFQNGVLIHTGNDGDSNSSLLLDLTHESTNYSFNVYNAALVAGQSFSDPAAGLTITTTSATAGGASVAVSFSPASCVHANPGVSLGGPGQSVAAGTAQSYTVTVSNADSGACASSSFKLSSTLPAGWSGSFAAASLSLAPGASGSTTLTVTSPASAAAGSYSVSASAANTTATAYTGSASATYAVAAPVLSETVSTSQASYARGATVPISATVRSGSGAVGGASVTFTVTKPNGSSVVQSASTASNGVASYSLRLSRKDPTGSYQVRASAVSGSQSASASTSFSVQ